MASIDMRPIPVRTGSRDREGRLVLSEGELVALLVRLDDEMHGEAQGRWFLEAAFGSYLTQADPFSTLAEAEAWMRRNLAAANL